MVVSWNEPSVPISPEASAHRGLFGWNVTTPPETGLPLANRTLPFTGYTLGGGAVLNFGLQLATNTAPMTPRNARRCHMSTPARLARLAAGFCLRGFRAGRSLRLNIVEIIP